MKHIQRLLLAGFLVFQVQALSAQTGKNVIAKKKNPIEWYSYEKAYELNKKKPKKMMVDVYTDWCGWCRKMDTETFANPVIAEYMQKHFYCVKMDAEMKDTVNIDGVTFVNPGKGGKRHTHQLANEMLRGKMSYPSYVFLNEKGQRLSVISGYQPAKEFESILHYFGENAYNKSTWPEFQSEFKGKIK